MARPAASALVHVSGRRWFVVEREHRARAGLPSAARGVPVERVQLVEDPVVAIDDEHVPIAVRVEPRPGSPPSIQPRLRLRLLGNRIAGRTARRAGVALLAVVDERHRHERLAAGHDDVRDPVDGVWIGWIAGRAAPVGMQPACAADVIDERLAVRIDRRLADVEVPPVVGRQHRQRLRQGTAERNALRVRGGRCQDTRRQSTDKNGSKTDQNCMPHRGLSRAAVMAGAEFHFLLRGVGSNFQLLHQAAGSSRRARTPPCGESDNAIVPP